MGRCELGGSELTFSELVQPGQEWYRAEQLLCTASVFAVSQSSTAELFQ